MGYPCHPIRGRGNGHALTRILVALAWGFFVLASTIPPKWWEVGPFETLERREEIRAGLRLAGAMIEIDECIQW